MCKPTYVLSKNSKKVLLTQMHRQWMLHNFCEVATDFPDLLRKLRDPLNMRESEIVVYPDAGHAFFADYRPSYVKADAEESWKRAIAWLHKYGVM